MGTHTRPTTAQQSTPSTQASYGCHSLGGLQRPSGAAMLPRATRAVSSAFPIRTTAPISLHAISSSVARARPCIAAAAAAGDPSAGLQQQQQQQETSVVSTTVNAVPSEVVLRVTGLTYLPPATGPLVTPQAEPHTPNQDRLSSSSQATTSTPTSGSSLGPTTQDGTPRQRPQRKWRSRDHGPLPPELRPAPKPRQRFLVFAENSAKQALPVIVQVRGDGAALASSTILQLQPVPFRTAGLSQYDQLRNSLAPLAPPLYPPPPFLLYPPGAEVSGAVPAAGAFRP